MTKYWKPTRATYFDHVSKARITEVVSAAVSPKVAADLAKMKKADAAAAAELRLANVAWLPEILTDRDTPAVPSWAVRENNEDEDDAATGEDSGGAEGDDDAESDTGGGDKHVNNTPPPEAPSATHTGQPPWPFPTTTTLNSAQADSRTA